MRKHSQPDPNQLLLFQEVGTELVAPDTIKIVRGPLLGWMTPLQMSEKLYGPILDEKGRRRTKSTIYFWLNSGVFPDSYIRRVGPLPKEGEEDHRRIQIQADAIRLVVEMGLSGSGVSPLADKRKM